MKRKNVIELLLKGMCMKEAHPEKSGKEIADEILEEYLAMNDALKEYQERVRKAFKELKHSLCEEWADIHRKYQIPDSDIIQSEFEIYEKELGI